MKQHQACLFRRCGNQEIGDLPAPVALGCQEPLNLACSLHVISRRLDKVEDRQVGRNLVPFTGIACSVSDFEVGDASAPDPAAVRQGIDDCPD